MMLLLGIEKHTLSASFNSFRMFFRPAYFKIIEECVSQIVLHKSGLDPDFKKNHVDLDLGPLMEELKGTTLDGATRISS